MNRPRIRPIPVLSTALLGLVALGWATCALGQAPGSYTPQWQALLAAKPTAPGWLPARLPAHGGPTAVMTNIAGWEADRLAPTNRSTSLAVSSDHQRLAIVWLHNEGDRDPAGEPTVYASLGQLSDLGRFTAPTAIAVRPFPYALGAPGPNAKYNSAHNAPLVLPDRKGGFIALGVGMNANGYAENMKETGYAYAVSGVAAGSRQWSKPVLGALRAIPLGSSLSEMTGGVSADGAVHMLGQGHLGEFQGGMGYQRWRPWRDRWESAVLAAPFRTSGGQAYFVEGAGAVTSARDGRGVIHVAFAWNERGATPMFGLYYLVSRDGGVSWRNIQGQPVATPVRFGKNDASCAIIPANLSTQGYGGAASGVHSLSLALAPDGGPVILRAQTLASDPDRAQVVAYTFAGGRWVSVPVGQPMYWNFGGTGVTVNAKTGQVNAVLLDPGNKTRGGQVLLYAEPLASLRHGRAFWSRQVVGEAPNTTNYASSLQVAFVPNERAVFVFEPNYQNPGQVAPVLGQARLR
jgi:hypothetical protein